MPDPLVTLALRVPDALRAALEARAEAVGESPSALGRRLLSQGLGLPDAPPRVAVELWQVRPEVLERVLAERERRGLEASEVPDAR